MEHLIWDWNGTLFDDIHLLVEATSESLQLVGGAPITADDYRRHLTRPLSRFYSNLAGRDLSEAEWTALNWQFHEFYAERLDGAGLAPDAIDALEDARSSGLTQSILSMWVQAQLLPLAEKLSVSEYFVLIEGMEAVGSETKVKYLERHIARLNASSEMPIRASEITLIGDTVDDGLAARATGIHCVLVATGADFVADLEAVGYPVTDSLTAAVRIARVRA